MPIGYSAFQANNEPAKGFKVLVPRPADAYLGPWEDPLGTTAAGVALVNGLIVPGVRYIGQKVIIVANSTPGVPGGVTQAYVYWYRGGTGNGDLVEFASGSATGSEFVTGISAAGATFTRLVNALQGITTSNLWVSNGATFAGLVYGMNGLSLNGNATFGGSVTATTFTGNLNGIANDSWNLAGISGASYARLHTENIFGTLGGVTYPLANIPAGTSLGQGISFAVLTNAGFNGNVLIGPSGGVLPGGTQGVMYVRVGTTFERAVDFAGAVRAATFTGSLTGNASTATALNTPRGFSLSGDITAPAVNFDGTANVTLTTTIPTGSIANTKLANSTISGIALGSDLANLSAGHLLSGGPYNGSAAITLNATGASLGANTFTGLQTLTAGLSAAGGITFNGKVAVNETLTIIGSAGNTTFDTVGNATIGATLTVSGNLFVNGTQTTINSTNVQIDDKIFELGNNGIGGGSTGTDSAMDGSGIAVNTTGNPTQKTLLWKNDNGGAWTSNQHFNLDSGYAYRINGATALASTFLGSGVVGSSLASVGTVTNGTWNATAIGLAYGGAGADISGVATNGVIYKTATSLTATAAGTNGQILLANASGVPVFTSPTGLTVGTANKVKVQDRNTTNGEMFLTFVADAGDALDLWIDKASGITFNANTNILSCTQIEATIDGGVWS
jgi:hypothetical protein